MRRAARAERARAAGWLYSHTVKLAKATIPPIIMAARPSIVVTVSRIMPASLPLHLSLRRELSHGANAAAKPNSDAYCRQAATLMP